MRGESEAEFVSECLLMNRACIIGMHNVFLCNVQAGVCILSGRGAGLISTLLGSWRTKLLLT